VEDHATENLNMGVVPMFSYNRIIKLLLNNTI
jgi:hypothetical protein